MAVRRKGFTFKHTAVHTHKKTNTHKHTHKHTYTHKHTHITQEWVGTRDDVTGFVDETAAWLPAIISNTISLLKGFAEALQEPYADAVQSDSHAWRLREGGVLSPAKNNRPLTLSDGAQLASFSPGGEYIIHSGMHV
jgi:hypothetical protein